MKFELVGTSFENIKLVRTEGGFIALFKDGEFILKVGDRGVITPEKTLGYISATMHNPGRGVIIGFSEDPTDEWCHVFNMDTWEFGKIKAQRFEKLE